MKKQQRPRGFAILIVLAVIATASIILATQLASVKGQQGTELRISEEVGARDVAENCAEIADAYAEDWASTHADFDRLLDPNGTIEAGGSGDDFLPPSTLLAGTTTVVSVPPAQTTSMYRYRAFDVGTNGTCLLRFEDNSDDSSTGFDATTTSNNTVLEGTGVDVPERDRDRTIVITAIGLVPRRANQATAYVQAHARATVRRVRAMPASVAVGNAIEAGGTVDFSGSVCGAAAGVVADVVKGGACVCGVLDAELTSGSQGSCASCASCAGTAGSTISAGARPDPNVIVPAFTSLLANEAFGGPGSSGNNIAAVAYGAAVVYFRDGSATNPTSGVAYSAVGLSQYQPANSTDVFAWDVGDDNAATTLGAPLTMNAGAGPTDCRDTSALNPLPRPCKWTKTDADNGTAVCATGESPCWKWVARLNDGAEPDVDIRFGTTRNDNALGAAFRPKATALPNFKGNTTWTALAPGSCTTCGGATDVVTRAAAAPSYTIGSTSLAQVPHMVVIVDSTAASTTTLAIGGVSTGTAKLSVLTNDIVSFNGVGQCCATCNCSATCSFASTTLTKAQNGNGFAIRTSQSCSSATAGLNIFGTVECGTVDLAGVNECIVGGIVATSKPGTLACPLAIAGVTFCDTAASVCFKDSPQIIGDVVAGGNVCGKVNVSLKGGSLESESNIGVKAVAAITGHMRAELNIVTRGATSAATFAGNAGSGQAQGTASAMWIDASW